MIWCAQSDHFRPIFCTVLKSLTTYSVAMKSVIRKILYTCTSTITVLIGCCGFFSILLLNSRIRVHKLFPSLFLGAENPQIFTHYPGSFGNFSFFWVGARNPQIFFAPPRRAKFHANPRIMSPMRGEKPQNRLLSNCNSGGCPTGN